MHSILSGECKCHSVHHSRVTHYYPYSFIGQLTLARFRGDTTFGLVARIIATFFGGLVGTAIWWVCQHVHTGSSLIPAIFRYISTGSGEGNPYGLAVVCGVAFPFFFYARLYWPGPPVSNLIVRFSSPLLKHCTADICLQFFVTSALVHATDLSDSRLERANTMYFHAGHRVLMARHSLPFWLPVSRNRCRMGASPRPL